MKLTFKQWLEEAKKVQELTPEQQNLPERPLQDLKKTLNDQKTKRFSKTPIGKKTLADAETDIKSARDIFGDRNFSSAKIKELDQKCKNRLIELFGNKKVVNQFYDILLLLNNKNSYTVWKLLENFGIIKINETTKDIDILFVDNRNNIKSLNSITCLKSLALNTISESILEQIFQTAPGSGVNHGPGELLTILLLKNAKSGELSPDGKGDIVIGNNTKIEVKFTGGRLKPYGGFFSEDYSFSNAFRTSFIENTKKINNRDSLIKKIPSNQDNNEWKITGTPIRGSSFKQWLLDLYNEAPKETMIALKAAIKAMYINGNTLSNSILNQMPKISEGPQKFNYFWLAINMYLYAKAENFSWLELVRDIYEDGVIFINVTDFSNILEVLYTNKVGIKHIPDITAGDKMRWCFEIFKRN